MLREALHKSGVELGALSARGIREMHEKTEVTWLSTYAFCVQQCSVTLYKNPANPIPWVPTGHTSGHHYLS